MLEWHGPQALSISEIATRVGFSKSWFWTAFKTRYGETPLNFQKRRRHELSPYGIGPDSMGPEAR